MGELAAELSGTHDSDRKRHCLPFPGCPAVPGTKGPYRRFVRKSSTAIYSSQQNLNMNRTFSPKFPAKRLATSKSTRVDSSSSCYPHHSQERVEDDHANQAPEGLPAAPRHPDSSPSRRGSMTSRLGDLKIALFFILPAMIGFVVFYLVPTIRGIYLSFTEYSILGDPKWIGIDNYTAIFAKDELFWNAMAVTLQYVGPQHRLPDRMALGLALLMHRVAKSTFVRGALLLPVPGGQRHRRPCSGSGCWTTRSASSTQFIEMDGPAPRRLLRQRAVGHPHHAFDQRLAAHGLHRAADLRRPAGHPEPPL